MPSCRTWASIAAPCSHGNARAHSRITDVRGFHANRDERDNRMPPDPSGPVYPISAEYPKNGHPVSGPRRKVTDKFAKSYGRRGHICSGTDEHNAGSTECPSQRVGVFTPK